METKVVSQDSFLDKLSEKLYLNGHLDFEKGNRVFAKGGGGGAQCPPPLGFWSTREKRRLPWDRVKAGHNIITILSKTDRKFEIRQENFNTE